MAAKTVIFICFRGASAIVREYVFTFFKIQKTRLFTLFEVSFQKNVKNVESVIQVFTLLHFEIAK